MDKIDIKTFSNLTHLCDSCSKKSIIEFIDQPKYSKNGEIIENGIVYTHSPERCMEGLKDKDIFTKRKVIKCNLYEKQIEK